MQSVSIIGPGRIGGALAIALSRAGFSVERLVYRTQSDLSGVIGHISLPPSVVSGASIDSLDSDLIFITVADPDISSVAEILAKKINNDSVVLHASGALSSTELEAIRERGIAVGSMHPLVAVSDPILGADSFSGAYFCLEGDQQAVAAASEIVSRLNGQSFSIATEFKSLYHAGAVMAAGHLVSLIDASIDVFEACGIERPVAKEVLMPLVESAVNNVKQQRSTEAALTGPFVRADLAAIVRHLGSLDSAGLTTVKNIYVELGLHALKMIGQNGENSEKLGEIRKSIMIAKALAK